MKQFLLQNWKYILGFILLATTIIVSAIITVKKSGGKVSFFEALKAKIIEQIPLWVDLVEREGHGEEKKDKVLNMAISEAACLLGRPLTDDEKNLIIAMASNQIEAVLKTPQKKEASNKKSKSKYTVEQEIKI